MLIISGLFLGGSCARIEVGTPATVVISGTFAGIHNGTDDAGAFTNRFLQFTITEVADSVTGFFESDFISGTFAGIRSDLVQGVVDVTFDLTQNVPCAGAMSGTGQARRTLLGTGVYSIGFRGSFSGTNCDGVYDGEFLLDQSP
jgi:hypothetical protein